MSPFAAYTGAGDAEDRRWRRWGERVGVYLDCRRTGWDRIADRAARTVDRIGWSETERLAWDAYCERTCPRDFIRTLSRLA